MTCTNSQPFKQKPPITQNFGSRFIPKASPYGKKTDITQKISDPLKNQCLDFVVKTFESDDFFMLQDGSTLVMNLTN